MQGSTQSKGQYGEELALRHLKQHGLKLLTRNYRCRFGEIDIVMQDQNTLVFVEVKYRRTQAGFATTELVDYSKQKKIIHTANHFLRRHDHYRDTVARFDVIGITGTEISWIRSAFET